MAFSIANEQLPVLFTIEEDLTVATELRLSTVSTDELPIQVTSDESPVQVTTDELPVSSVNERLAVSFDDTSISFSNEQLPVSVTCDPKPVSVVSEKSQSLVINEELSSVSGLTEEDSPASVSDFETRDCLSVMQSYNHETNSVENNSIQNNQFDEKSSKIDEKIEENDFKMEENNSKIEKNDSKIKENDSKMEENDSKLEEGDLNVEASNSPQQDGCSLIVTLKFSAERNTTSRESVSTKNRLSNDVVDHRRLSRTQSSLSSSVILLSSEASCPVKRSCTASLNSAIERPCPFKARRPQLETEDENESIRIDLRSTDEERGNGCWF